MSEYASNVLFSIDTALQRKGGVNLETIVATKNLTYQDSSVQFITPSGGTKTVMLPPVKSGCSFLVCNLSTTQVLKVRTYTDVGLEDLEANSGATPAKSSIYCWSDGVVWCCMIIVSYSGFSV
jgi:hypothetical protein